MVAVLLALGLFIVLLQLGVMTLVRRLAQQLEVERARLDKLERAVARSASGMADFMPTLTPQAPPAAPRRPPDTAAAPPAAPAPAAPPLPPVPAFPTAAVSEPEARVDPAELRGEMLGLMRQLVDQGLSVRDIAARCGLSEAEAELMLSLHGSSHD